jgi:hypothetical protein
MLTEANVKNRNNSLINSINISTQLDMHMQAVVTNGTSQINKQKSKLTKCA